MQQGHRAGRLRIALGVLATLGVACAGNDVVPPEETGAPVDPPCLSVDPVAIDYGEVRLGTDAAPATLTLANDCAGSLVLGAVALQTGETFVIDDVPAPGTVLEQGEAVAVAIRAVVPDYGRFDDVVTIESNDPDAPSTAVDVTLAVVCESVAVDVDNDGDGVPNGCDACLAGDDALDDDRDGIPDACDVCPGGNDAVDDDGDAVPDDCDLCPGGDDALDDDADGIPNFCDGCDLGDDSLDGDGDSVPDACDLCPGFDDRNDVDADFVPDDCDVCPGGDDFLDADLDSVPDACDACPGVDDRLDDDSDTVPDCVDRCPGFDDLVDDDGDTVPNGCDRCLLGDDLVDTDLDTVADACDACPGANDLDDADGDTVPDACDVCPGPDDLVDDDGDSIPDCNDVCPLGPNNVDTDADTVPDACDQCPGADDRIDTDLDTVPDCADVCPSGDDLEDVDGSGIPDDCEACPGFDNTLDADQDTVPDGCDTCPGFDDRIDLDGDGNPDAEGCDLCLGFDDNVDTDGDGVPGDGSPASCDVCEGGDDALDDDLDGVPDVCDACRGSDDAVDDDADGIPDGCDVCPGSDDFVDTDFDTVPDGCDTCPGSDDVLDDDSDTVPDGCDTCPGFDDLADADADLVADGCERCPGFDDGFDADADGVPDDCDTCPAADDGVDVDLDGFPDACDPCVGATANLALSAPVAPSTKVDVLLVVEDTFAMQPYLSSIPTGVTGFVNQMNGLGADWQLALITSSSPTFIGPVIPGGPNALAQLVAQFGSYGLSASAVTEGIAQAWSATQPGGDAGPGSTTGFLRSDAALGVVFVTDSPDTSPIATQTVFDYWVSLKSRPADVRVGSIDSTAPDPVNTLVDLSGGPSFPAPSTVFATATVDIATFVVGDLSPRAPLPGNVVLVPGTLEVEMAGVTVADWFYDPFEHAIVFPDGPSFSGPLQLTYVEDCDGTLGACADGVDNDNDGLIDFPEEPGCASRGDSNESDPLEPPTCIDGLDNDGDGATDWPADGECDAASDGDEDCLELATDEGGYTMCEIPATVPTCPDLSASSASRLSLGNDGSVELPLGFGFDFYGVDYTSVFVGANGSLGFSSPASPAGNVCLPDSGLGDAIFAWWDDLDPGQGDVWARTRGVAPNRSFAVHWQAPHDNGFTDVDVRAVLHEATGDIEICYVSTAAGPGLANGFSATAGIQHSTTSFLEFSCNAGNLVQDLTVRFEHP